MLPFFDRVDKAPPNVGDLVRLNPGEAPPERATVIQGKAGGRAFRFEPGPEFDAWKIRRNADVAAKHKQWRDQKKAAAPGGPRPKPQGAVRNAGSPPIAGIQRNDEQPEGTRHPLRDGQAPCMPGMHRHESYGDGECHPEEQRHRDGSYREARASVEASAIDDLLERLDLVDRRLSEIENPELLQLEEEYARLTYRLVTTNEPDSVENLATRREAKVIIEKLANFKHKEELAKLRDRRALLEEKVGEAVAGMERERFTGELASDDVSSVADIGHNGGVNAGKTSVISVKPGVFEPKKGLSDTKAVLKKVEREAAIEVCSYEISELLGFGLVPEVRRVDWGDGDDPQSSGFGHMMRWTDHAGDQGASAKIAAGADTSSIVNRDAKMKQEWMKLWVFDLLIGNVDRHQYNAVVDVTHGKIWAIDNGYAFWPQVGPNLGKIDKKVILDRLESGRRWNDHRKVKIVAEDLRYVNGLLDHIRRHKEDLKEIVTKNMENRSFGSLAISMFNARLDDMCLIRFGPRD